LVIDQSGNIGILQRLKSGNQAFTPNGPEPEKEQNIDNTQEVEPLSELDREIDAVPMREDARKAFEKERNKQRIPLLPFLDNFNFPESLAIYFPNVRDGHIDPPEKRTFVELRPLRPFASALELRFCPLFELPTMKVETQWVEDALPEMVWKVCAIDVETQESTPMFLFQLKESGLEMDWQLEGLSNQHLYDTILSSLGFLQIGVSDEPQSAKEIPLFAPEKWGPVKVSELAKLSLSDIPEMIVDLPFASELWEEVFADKNPPYTLVLEVRAEPEGDWAWSVSSSEIRADVRTSQQADKHAESGKTLFENIAIPFMATASLEKVVWKASEYSEWLHAEQETLQSAKIEWEKKIEKVKGKIFDRTATETDQSEHENYKAEWKACDIRLKEIESILEKLPEAYREICQKESARFHYSVFLQPAGGTRRLLILTTVEEDASSQ
jgi:hypothetical protein